MELQYKGFIAKIFFVPKVDAFCGEVLNSKDLISFQVDDLQDANYAMQQAIDHYLEHFASVLDETPEEA